MGVMVESSSHTRVHERSQSKTNTHQEAPGTKQRISGEHEKLRRESGKFN